MARPGVTYGDVAKAAAELQGQGRAPTIELIRGILKGGSNSTIGTHLRAWRAQQTPTEALLQQTGLPAELIGLMQGLWERMGQEADLKVEAIQAQTAAELAALQAALTTTTQENTELQQALYQTRNELQSLAQEKTALEHFLIAEKREVASLEATITGFTHQMHEKQARIEEAQRQNQQAQANLEHYREASLAQRQLDQQRAEDTQRSLEHTIHGLQRELGIVKPQLLEMQQFHAQLGFEKAALEAQLEKVTSQQTTLTAQLAEAKACLAQQAQAAAHWQAEAEKWQNRVETEAKSRAELETQQAISAQQVAALAAELKDYKAQNQVLAQEKWELGQEKAQLLGQMKQMQSKI